MPETNSYYPRNKGLFVGEKAPDFKTEDIDGNIVILQDLLKNYHGVLIDFFRGAW